MCAATPRRRKTDSAPSHAGFHSAFTLIELLVIIGIIAVMTGVGVLSVQSGQGAVRVKGATRDIFASIRHARSQALVSQKPVVITYSTEEVDGEPVAKVETTSAKLFNKEIDRSLVRTVKGDALKASRELVHIERNSSDKTSGKSTSDASSSTDDGGSIITDVLFQPINEDVVRGMRLKVVVGEEYTSQSSESRKPRISLFSNVDYLLGKYQEQKSSEKKANNSESDSESKGSASSVSEKQEPVSVVWETNGRVDPHQVWVYPDGHRPEDGLMIRIDRFGAAKVLSGDGREEDE